MGRCFMNLQWNKTGSFQHAVLGDPNGGDGVRFSLEHYPTCYRRGPFVLKIEVAVGLGHELWGCFDEQDQPVRNFHDLDRAFAEADAIATVLWSDRVKERGRAQSLGLVAVPLLPTASRSQPEKASFGYHYPTTEEVCGMDSEEVAHHVRLLELCRQRLQRRADELGAKGLWLVAINPHDSTFPKISAIKMIREITGLGLKEAKAMCDIVDAGSPQLVSGSVVDGNPYVEALKKFATIEWR